MKEIEKITHGHVVQRFNLETGQLVSQHFTASCDVDYEDIEGNPIETTDEILNLYHPFYMIEDDSLERAFNDIDWELLKKQKQTLVNLAAKETKEAKLLDGLISLIDSLQDIAVDKKGIPEEKVFNLESEEDEAEQQLIDEKNGLYPDKEDIAN